MSKRSALTFSWPAIAVMVSAFLTSSVVMAQVLDKQQLLKAETFWDNQDWDWYFENIPFFECPDPDITTTYYYRWELLTKHLTYGSPNTGYVFTEFIDRPFWSGAYGAISCPAGHQLYEARWLRQPTIARDYLRYWFRNPGAQPRNYSTWLADSAWALHQVHRDEALLVDLLPDMVKNYEGWEQRHFVPEVGLFWQTGHDDGMEFNINSRQTQDILRGAPSYRPSFNAYMWADAIAIAKIARLSGDIKLAVRFENKAASLKEKVQSLLWDPQRQFFFPVFKNDEVRDGHQLKALTKTYETGEFAGDSHGRELIGYVPWQFGMLDRDKGYEAAWLKLMDPDAFFANFGPTTVERHDPMFLLMNSCCWWSGQSWPYATTQTLKALSHVIRMDLNAIPGTDTKPTVTTKDYFKLLQIFAKSHRKDGKPYLAEALHPDTGSFEGHDAYNHSEHYFHSGFCDLVITGLAGLVPVDEASFEVQPLIPETWDWFALDDVAYQGRRVSILWDRLGSRYGKGKGLTVLVDGMQVANTKNIERISVKLPTGQTQPSVSNAQQMVNFAVNNDGTYYPRITASYTAAETSTSKLNDGNYWYMRTPPNRWTCADSPHDKDWIVVDFGMERLIHTLKLYLLDDGETEGSSIGPPQRFELEYWDGQAWCEIPSVVSSSPMGRRANTVTFAPMAMSKVRVTLQHRDNRKSGMTEFEAWGDASLPVAAAPPPVGNLALNSGAGTAKQELPKATASFTSRFDRLESANDGIVNFSPTPANRWTSYESKSTSDWLEIDFGKAIEFRRVELAIYDDRGGVQAPSKFLVQYLQDDKWSDVTNSTATPEQPTGGQWNEVRFDPVTSSKVRMVFTHQGTSRSGVSEVLVWND